MIELHRLNKVPFFLNHRLIETIESHPDTVIRLTNDRKYLVVESPVEIQNRIQNFEAEIFDRARHGDFSASIGKKNETDARNSVDT